MNKGFEAVIDDKCTTLILGSFPSVVSRKNQFYYGNKSNRFWAVLSAAFDEKFEDTIEAKTAFILKHHIALWDILELCSIEGSSDSDINKLNSKPVDLPRLLKKYPNIQKIICNGKKAFELLNLHFKNLDIPIICLPSTSPANVRFNINCWLDEFQH